MGQDSGSGAWDDGRLGRLAYGVHTPCVTQSESDRCCLRDNVANIQEAEAETTRRNVSLAWRMSCTLPGDMLHHNCTIFK